MSSLGTAPVSAPPHYADADIAIRLTLTQAVDAVREALLLDRDGGIEQPLRQSLGDGRLLVMSARAIATGDAVVKTVRVSAHGGADGIPDGVHGLLLSVDGATGRVATADAAALTVLRTAAMVSLATDALAPVEAATLAVLGAGEQARAQAAAVALVRPLRSVRIWNRTRARAETLAADLARQLPTVAFEVAATAEDAVRDSEVVCCATAATAPLFDRAALGPRVHVNAVGAYRRDMHEFATDVLAAASTVGVDNPTACLRESGEIVSAVADGAVEADALRSLADLVLDPPAREGITVFKSVGIAAADLAMGRLLQTIEPS